MTSVEAGLGARYRDVAVTTATTDVAKRGDAWYLRSNEPLREFPVRLTDRLVSGAQAHPQRVLVARRNEQGAWIEITYADMLRRARAIGQALQLAHAGDVILIAGKGHETYHETAAGKRPFDDMAIALAALDRLTREPRA